MKENEASEYAYLKLLFVIFWTSVSFLLWPIIESVHCSFRVCFYSFSFPKGIANSSYGASVFQLPQKRHLVFFAKTVNCSIHVVNSSSFPDMRKPGRSFQSFSPPRALVDQNQ